MTHYDMSIWAFEKVCSVKLLLHHMDRIMLQHGSSMQVMHANVLHWPCETSGYIKCHVLSGC